MTRYASIWFPNLLTEYVVRKKPEFREVPFVLAAPQHGRMVIESVNHLASQKGIRPGMVLADCKAILPELQMLKTEPGRSEKLLQALAEWSIMYTPFAAVDLPDGLILDTSGCTHLWGNEVSYLQHIQKKMAANGYTVRSAIADTIGTAWAIARFGKITAVIEPGGQREALLSLPPAALRLDAVVLNRLNKLGLRLISSFINMPSSHLRRRFGASLPFQIGLALGEEIELPIPVKPIPPYHERLSSMEPIASANGIAIALHRLLEMLCIRLETEEIGLRSAIFKAYRVDGTLQQIEIGTGQPSRNTVHLFKLFEHKIATFEPDLGFELFVLEAPKVASITNEQHAIWSASCHNDIKIAEFFDRAIVRNNPDAIARYLPAAQYWPERSIKKATPLWEKPSMKWQTNLPRPIHVLPTPEQIEVSATLPDYPPMLFRHQGIIHTVVKSDGPERIEQEWWLTDGLYRDYYCIEDENGARYWLFRSGPYDSGQPKWFIHGFFA